ncbi:hypothetical protein LTR08_002721 [Meristemomyces frigidus]|nr:hypothetical protein LTR08_002721 [Meristemomyces frigidus]
MAPWLRFLEAWAVEQLLRTPAFHRVVEKVAKNVHRVRNGHPPEELGGTHIDRPGESAGFLGHFYNEVKTQLGKAEAQQKNSAGVNIDSRAMSGAGTTSKAEAQAARVDEMDSEAAWKDVQARAAVPAKRGLAGEYAQALRRQFKSDKP